MKKRDEWVGRGRRVVERRGGRDEWVGRGRRVEER